MINVTRTRAHSILLKAPQNTMRLTLATKFLIDSKRPMLLVSAMFRVVMLFDSNAFILLGSLLKYFFRFHSSAMKTITDSS